MTRAWAIVVVGAALYSAPGTAALSEAVFLFSPADGQSQTLKITAPAGALTLTASDMGWYDHTGAHESTNSNYIAGLCGMTDGCGGADRVHRNFFVFDLPLLAGAVATGATLSLGNPDDGYLSPDAAETYELYDVNTPLAELSSNQIGRTDVFDDLGSGVLLGAIIVSSADNGTQVLIELSSDGLAYVNSHLGGAIAFGGRVRDLNPIPVPAPWALFAVGAFALRSIRRH